MKIYLAYFIYISFLTLFFLGCPIIAYIVGGFHLLWPTLGMIVGVVLFGLLMWACWVLDTRDIK